MTHLLPLFSLPGFSLPELPDLSDLSRASGSWLATLGVGLAIGLPASTEAAPLEDSETRARPASTRWLDPNAERPPTWMGENVYYKKGTGLEYRQETKFGESPIEIGVQGPLLRKKKDPSVSGFSEPGMRQRRMSGVGVTVEVRF
jgi:hypothetical protein